MSILGRQTPGPTRINQVQINQSVLGFAIPVVMGRGKVQQTILWVDGYTSVLVNSSGGKGFGGGKDGNQIVYSADVIAALCAGPIAGIGDVWSGQSWLQNTVASESYTITGGTPVYVPTWAAHLTADLGVAHSVPYSGLFGDLGSGGTSLAGSHLVPLKPIAYGTTPLTGQYAVNPGTGAYIFSPADVGLTVQLFYSFDLGSVSQQLVVLIPSSGNVSVGSSTTGTGATPFKADGGVVYETGPNDGQRVTGYTISGTTPATYHFASGDIGKEVRITYTLNTYNVLAVGTSKTLNFAVFEGYPEQAPWALTETNFPGAALGYSGIAYAAYAPMDLGYGAQIQQNVFEVITPDGWGGGIADCSPVQCILQVLTNPTWGLGVGAVPFPVSAIDLVTWGSPANTGAARQDSTAVSWFAANGFFISPVIDKQDSASSVISRWLEAGQCAVFMSEGLMKLVPYGDTSTAGNGAVWVAPSTFAAALDDTCFISKNGLPVKITSSPWQDAYNTVQVQWNNRAAQYSPEITPEWDQAAINRYGSRIEDPQSWEFITTLAAATFAASMRVKRNVYTRNTYEFTLSYRYSDLEPMDVVYLTTSSVWAAGANNQNLGVNSLPVRITKTVDNPEGTIDFVCEDYPFGAHQPVIYLKGTAVGVVQPNLFADPGDAEVVIFEASDRLTGYQGNELWIGADGATDFWGGCAVLASMDGTTYRQIGEITSPARLGVLGAALPLGVDPDVTDSLVLDLTVNSRALEAGTTADADQDNTMVFVDGEVISYSAMAITGLDQYTGTGYLRRGRMGTVQASHAAGALVMRLDDSVFKYTYDPSWAGKTIYLKFPSFNVYGNSSQDPASLTAVTFTIPGLNPGTVDASSGLIIGFTSASLPANIALNTGNDCALTTVWDTTSGTATVNGDGPGGSGTAWDFLYGQGTRSYPAFVITGLTGGTKYAIAYNTKTSAYSAATSFPALLPDGLIVIGAVTTATATVAGTGGGGGGGGGTGGDGSGGLLQYTQSQ